MITQLLNYKDQVCKQIEFILHDTPPPHGEIGREVEQKKIAQLRRAELFPVKRLTSPEEVEQYLDEIRKKLNQTLEANDGIQIN